jgi:hypothetical protein
MDDQLNRRQFLRHRIRWTMLGALGALGGLLVWRGQACNRVGACQGCQLAGRCELPEAVRHRQTTKGVA